MPQLTSLYRTTKTRNAKSQDQLRSSLLVHKQSASKRSETSSYHQTYGVQLPQVSVSIITPIISALTGMNAAIDIQMRSLYTVGIWREDARAIYRCCFIQPEIASATCSMPAAWRPTAENALTIISDSFPDAVPCTLSGSRLPQLSGRMAPYVANTLPFSVSWGFANIAGSYFLFLRTDDAIGQAVLTLSREAVSILQSYFPDYSVCVFDINTNSYKITVAPEVLANMNEPNKNTCMHIYGDGSFRLQGKPSVMKRVCESFRHAVHEVAVSNSWSSFTSKLIPLGSPR